MVKKEELFVGCLSNGAKTRGVIEGNVVHVKL